MFDTSAVIQWLKGNDNLAKLSDPITISAITVYELLWTSSKRKQKVKEAVESFISSSSILNIDYQIASEGAKTKMKLLANGKDKPMADIMIAVSAKMSGLSLVTFDADFEDIQDVLDFDLKYFGE